MSILCQRFNRAFILIACVAGLGCSNNFQSGESDLASENTSNSVNQVAITNPAEFSYNKGQVSLVGTCSPGTDVEIFGDVIASSKAACINRKFNTTVQLSAGDGSKNVKVSQKDTQGKQTMTSRSFNRDTTAPALSVIAPASNTNVKDSVVIQGLCETGLDVNFSGAASSGIVVCANGAFASTVPLISVDGYVSVILSQTDKAGNKAETVLKVNKDTVAPVISISSPAASSVVAATAALSGACESGLTVTASGSGLSSSATGLCNMGSYNITVVFSNGTGDKSVTISQADSAGNVGSIQRSFQRNVTGGPVLAFTSPADGFVFKDKVTMTGTCQTGLNVYFSGAGIGATNLYAACTNGTFTAEIGTSFTSGDGPKNVIVTQTNSLGQSGSASRTFVRDNLAPKLTIVSPVAGTEAKAGVQLAGACENSLPVVISGAGVSASSNATCSSGAYSATIIFSANDGVKNVIVSQTDSGGSVTSVNRDFKRDNVAPVVSITSPAANTIASMGLTLIGTCEGNYQVTASGTGVSSAVSKSCSNGNYSLDIIFSAGDGTKNVKISQTDNAGNTGSISRDFVRGSVVIPDGPLLYAQNCAGCHGALATSTKKDRSAATISAAITAIPSMSALRSLTSSQVSAIAAALASTQPPLACTATDLGAKPLARLDNREFRLTLFDLTETDHAAADNFPGNGRAWHQHFVDRAVL